MTKKKNLKFKLKVTASKELKCNMCRKKLYGKEGFIDISFCDWQFDIRHKRICLDCFNSSLKEIEKEIGRAHV